jgi:hypothetical protein
VDEVPVDIEDGGSTGNGFDDVTVPDLFKKCFWHG